MIANPNSEYNPLRAILANSGNLARNKSIKERRSTYTPAFFDFVRRELFLGGLAFESDDEFTKALDILEEMEVI